MIHVAPLCQPQLDPDFVPAALWNREYLKLAAEAPNGRKVRIGVDRPEGTTWIYETTSAPGVGRRLLLIPSNTASARSNSCCGHGAAAVCASAMRPTSWRSCKAVYAADGKRAFDYEFMGNEVLRYRVLRS